MAYGLFIYKPESGYNDSPWKQYQFPKRYQTPARKCEGDWVVYFEPTRANQPRGYFATARVAEIVLDPRKSDMFLAIIEPGTYLDFGEPVPFRLRGAIVEERLLNAQEKLSGRRQWSVRELYPTDFARIVSLGLGLDSGDEHLDDPDSLADGNSEVQFPSNHPSAERTVRLLTDDGIRDRNFQRTVLRAYGKSCAITGLQLINGGGRAEASAARIRPSDHDGPDATSNGIALSGTARWMFERGLVSLEDDMTVLVSHQSNDPDSIRAMINRSGRLKLPIRSSERPGTEFLMWHRENRFMR